MDTQRLPGPAPEPEAEPPAPFFQRLSFDLACALKAVADRGGAGGYVRAPDAAPSKLRELRKLGLVETLDGMGGLEVVLTAAGAAALPRALSVIVAGPGRSA